MVKTKKDAAADKPYHRYYERNPGVPKLKWLDLLGRAAISSDGHRLGKIEAVNSAFIVIKKGLRKITRYWIPTDKTLAQGSSVTDNGNLKLPLMTQDQLKPFRKDDVPNPANFATLGASTSHMAYPPMPYLPDEMLKEKYRQKKNGSDKEPTNP